MGSRQSGHVESVTQSTRDDNTLDILTLAQRLRQKQGPYEVEVACGDEADLHRHYNSCEKNPDHKNFIPVNQFTRKNLPLLYRNDDLIMDRIRAISDLTVRVTVKYVSDKRPQTWLYSDRPFPRYDGGFKDMERVATGYVTNINYVNKTCPCEECRDSPTPKTKFAYINIVTAIHVVYDDLEAAHTTCHLFFNYGGTPKNCKGVVTLNEFTLSKISGLVYDSNDWAVIKCVSHDMDLVSGLGEKCNIVDYVKKHPDYAIKDVYTKKKTCVKQNVFDRKHFKHLEDVRPLCVIVSHPHGCSKQISLGYCIEVDGNQYSYTTATCPGSSGACVFLLDNKYHYSCGRLVHSGSYNWNHNYCCNAYLYMSIYD